MSDTLDALPMWVVYDHPRDYPDLYVARKHIWNAASKTYVGSDLILTSDALEILQSELHRMGLAWLPRHPADDPLILGVWL